MTVRVGGKAAPTSVIGPFDAHFFLGLTHSELSNHDAALESLETAIRLSGRSRKYWQERVIRAPTRATANRARQILGALLTLSRRRYVLASLIGQIYAGLGEPYAGLQCLETACEQRAADFAWLGVRPLFDSLRSESRFRAMCDTFSVVNGPLSVSD